MYFRFIQIFIVLVLKVLFKLTRRSVFAHLCIFLMQTEFIIVFVLLGVLIVLLTTLVSSVVFTRNKPRAREEPAQVYTEAVVESAPVCMAIIEDTGGDDLRKRVDELEMERERVVFTHF